MSLWGPLQTRYETARPRKLLALDGGGVRGIMTLEVLVRMEQMLAQALGRGRDFRLCDFFDYIGGTSTGAIIAAGLARGMSALDLLEFYRRCGAEMFDKTSLLFRWRSLYKSEPLAQQLQQVFGAETTLEPQHLRCLLLAVTRNMTTDSPWPISSNPLAKYNDPQRTDCNLRIPLWQIVRASTSAPVYFPPEVVQWDPQDERKCFVFVDGGVTPYNNPAFLLYRMATQPAYGLNWATGEDQLLLVSVGTGAAPKISTFDESPDENLLFDIGSLPDALMYGCLMEQDTNCRTVGRCVYGAPLDREQGDLIPRDAGGHPLPLTTNTGKAFLYARYNADLTSVGLTRLGLGHICPENVCKLDSVEYLDDLSAIGRRVAEEIQLEHFGSFLEA